MTRINSIRMVLAIVALRNLEVHQMDVKAAFLNGDLDEETYMEQPEDFISLGQEKKVYRLVKSLYGLKQAPKQWHQKFDSVIMILKSMSVISVYMSKIQKMATLYCVCMLITCSLLVVMIK